MTARPLLLVGAGGLARETLVAVRAQPDRWRPIGAVDDDAARQGGDVDGVPVIGGTERVHDFPDAAVVLCVASPARPGGRLRLAERLGLLSDRWATVVHPAASIAPGTVLGEGSVVLANVVVTAPITVGAHVMAMPHVLLTHDDEIADGVILAGRATLAGGVRVGSGAYLGQGSMVREYLSIGAGAVIGMGAVVLADVPDGQTWAGVPARKLR
ncbi:MAG TPA: NeuD/PglB/VioB family sugar acetyltransferase [Pseudonocardiaceae bacterium]|jgi:sugar O-acyltransferase (sialic acid O-acetyltransferase NeuD family)|nr:NeuD/PglB/VioB family sugar acetyltransferase [Pseudonocardiaceae bacterium]